MEMDASESRRWSTNLVGPLPPELGRSRTIGHRPLIAYFLAYAIFPMLTSRLGALLLATVAHGARLVAVNHSLALDGNPFTLQAVLYSPTPWGYDTDLHYHSARL